MSAIITFFESIFNIIKSLVDFVIGIIDDIVYLVQLTGRFLMQIPSYLGWLPSSIVASLVAIFTIVVLYKILGREG